MAISSPANKLPNDRLEEALLHAREVAETWDEKTRGLIKEARDLLRAEFKETPVPSHQQGDLRHCEKALQAITPIIDRVKALIQKAKDRSDPEKQKGRERGDAERPRTENPCHCHAKSETAQHDRELLKSRPNRTVADSIEELIIEPVHRSHFLEITAPAEHYTVPKAVSDDEIAGFRESISDRTIQKALLTGHRKEVVAFGLLEAARGLCVRICEDAGYIYAQQHGESLAREILQQLEQKAFEAFRHTQQDQPDEA
jgi:hypothetical protein